MSNIHQKGLYFLFVSVILMLLFTSMFGHSLMRMAGEISCTEYTGSLKCQILEIMTNSNLPSVVGLLLLSFILVRSLIKERLSDKPVNLSFITFYKRRLQNFSIIPSINYHLSQGILHPKLF